MKEINYKKCEGFSDVIITIGEMNRRCLFTILRIDPESLPEGLYRYDIRHSDEDWEEPCTIENKVRVNHFGAIITNEPITFDHEDYSNITSFERTGFGVKASNIEEYFKQLKELNKDK